MPDGFHDVARRRSAEVTEAIERARAVREANAPKSREELARERRARLEAQDAARAATSVPPPGHDVLAGLEATRKLAVHLGVRSDASDFDVGWTTDDLLDGAP